MNARGRATARARSRGVALVEAVVVVPMFIVLFAMFVFVWKIYSFKVSAMALARQQVWTYAQSANCGTNGDASEGYSPPSTSGVLGRAGAGMLPTTSAEQANQYSSAAGGANTLSSDIDMASAVAPTVQVSAGHAGGGDSAQIGATKKLTCNEAPYDGNLIGAGTEAIHDLTSWSFWQ